MELIDWRVEQDTTVHLCESQETCLGVYTNEVLFVSSYCADDHIFDFADMVCF